MKHQKVSIVNYHPKKKIKNNKFPEIENIIKNVNKISLKKYSTNNLEKKINYSKYKSSQKNQENNMRKKKRLKNKKKKKEKKN